MGLGGPGGIGQLKGDGGLVVGGIILIGPRSRRPGSTRWEGQLMGGDGGGLGLGGL